MAAVYRARWVDSFGPRGVIATDEVIADAVLAVLAPSATVARIHAALRLISPDHITPQGRRILELVLETPAG